MLGFAFGLTVVLVMFIIAEIRRKRNIAYHKRIRSDYQNGGIQDYPHSLSSPEYSYPADSGQNTAIEDSRNFGGGDFGGAGAGDSYEEGNSYDSGWGDDTSSDSDSSGGDSSGGDSD